MKEENIWLNKNERGWKRGRENEGKWKLRGKDKQVQQCPSEISLGSDEAITFRSKACGSSEVSSSGCHLVQELVQSQMMMMSSSQVEQLVPVAFLQVLVDLKVCVNCHLNSRMTD